MRKNIARKLALLLALVVLVTTCGADYNSISVRATTDEAILEQEKSTENDYSELFTEEIGAEQSQEEAPAEEISEEPVEETVEEPVQEEIPETVEEAPAEEPQEAVQEEPAQEASAEEAAPAPENDQAPAEEAAPVDASAEAPADTPAPAEDAAPAEETPAEVPAETVEAPAEVPAETVEAPAEVRNVTVTYTASKGGKVSKDSETIDLNAEGAAFEGATASARNDKYEFVNWTDANGTEVSTDATFVPANIEADTTFKANFKLVENLDVDMPELSVNDVHEGGMVVSVSADEGIFPEGTETVIKAISDRQALETAQSELGDDVKEAKGVDISFLYKGEEIQPADDRYVHVNLALDEAIEGDSFTVLHDHDGEVEQIDANVTENEEGNAKNVEFDSNQFSIYIVAGETKNNRIHVVFKNGTADIADMYVKQDDNMEQVLYEPSFELPNGKIFKGWTQTQNYTKDTAGLSMDEVRTEVAALFPVDKDCDDGGVTVTYYAEIFDGFRITYIDDKGITLGEEFADKTIDTTSVSYKVSMSYTPLDDFHNFEGWNVAEGGDNIEGYETGKRYNLNDVITISGNVVFSVYAPEGHWLVFHENGSGATYVAPQFVYSGETPSEPEVTMTRNGYTFDGWYRDAACTTGNEFDFTQVLTEKTHIYAKWNPKEKAPYTVIIWTQNVGRTGYDLKEAYVENEGTVGEDIPYQFVENGDEDYVRIGNRKDVEKHYTGFCFDESKVAEEDREIQPEGNSTLNLYFDRIEYNVRFYIYRDSGSGNNRYSYANNSNAGQNTWGIATWYTSNRHPSLNGLTEEHATVDGYDAHYFVLNAYYGENIEQKWPKYDQLIGVDNRDPVSFIMMVGTKLKPRPSSGGDGTVKGVVSVLNENILGKTNDADGNFLIVRFPGNNYTWKYHCWYECVDGEDYTGKTTATVDGVKYYEDHIVDSRSSNDDVEQQNAPKYDGYICYSENNREVGFDNRWRPRESYQVQGDTSLHTNYLYRREVYKVSFFDGRYVEGDEGNFHSNDKHLIHESEDIDQGAVIPDDVKNYTPDPVQGYVFDGWYTDATCQNKYVFGTMPIGGVIVYAKWRKIQYRVFLHPNAETDPSLDWGSDDQGMNFRISYGDTISVPTGRRTQYIFLGWYTDPAGKNVYAPDTVLNEQTVTADYDKTADFTDDMDKWGNGATYNKDARENRYWVTKKLDLYAKWSKKLDGADGINVVYSKKDPKVDGEGTGTAVDGNTYVDGAPATAVPALKAPTGYHFDCWIMQKWDGTKFVDEGTEVKPGTDFTVLEKNAKIEEVTGGKKYTVQLRPKFKPDEEATPTFIPWFSNDGTEAFHIDTLNGEDKYDLAINDAVAIQEAPTRTGYTFVGWGKVSMGQSAEEADTFMNTADNWTQDSPTPFLYYKNGSFYSDEACTTEATKVAADEDMPYEAIFAIWERYYTVEYYKGEITDNTDTDHYLGKAENLGPVTAGQTTITLREGTGAGQLNYKKEDAGSGYKDGKQVPESYTIGDEDIVIKVLYPANKIIVTVKGSKEEVPYDGEEHSVTGFTVTAEFEDGTTIENVSADDFVYNGNTEENTTIVGTNVSDSDKIDFDPDLFTGAPEGYEDAEIEFVIDEEQPGNELIITPLEVTVSITGNNDRKEYNGQEQSVTGYTSEISGGDGLYTEDMFSYSGDDVASGTDVTDPGDPYPMNLDAEQFVNNDDDNFDVTFVIEEDGYLEIYAKAITVKITGNNDTVDYDTEYHVVEGFTAEADDPNYPKDSAIDYDGDTTTIREKDVKRKEGSEEVDKYPMGLDEELFSNNDPNYDVTFELVEDGWLEIDPISVTVYVKGDQKTFPYDGDEHEADGWDFVDPLSDFVTKDNVTVKTNDDGTRKDYIKEKDVKRTAEGTTDKYMMGLTAEDFECTDQNIIVTFEVEDGWLLITPEGTVTVKITGDVQEADYDTLAHTATGYTFEASDENYTADDFTFDNSSFEKVDEDGMPVIEKTDVNRDGSGNVIPYPMGLDESQFKNNNGNYEEVIFLVTDGKLTIKPVEITVTITGHKKTVRYNGQEQSVTDYDKECSSSTLFNVEEVEYAGEAIAKGTDHGTYAMNLKEDDFYPKHTDNLDITYEITDGELVIDPLQISLNVIGNQNTEYYDGTEKYAEGYTLNNPQILPPEEGKEYDPSEEEPDLNKLYDESKVKYDGEAKAKGILPNDDKNVEYPDHYPMNLDSGKFSYEDESGNIEAKFIIDEDGKLFILPRIDGNEFQLTLITEDDVQEFSGKTWTGADYTYKIKAEKSEVSIPERMIGAAKNLINGLLGILHVHAADDSKGKEFEIDGIKFYLSGFGVKVGDDDAARDVDKYKLNITETGKFVVVDADGNDVTENFKIKEFDEGDLTITKRRITLISGSAEKVYDGTALTEHSVTESPKWAEGDAVKYNFTGSQTEVGESDNLFTAEAANDITKLDKNYIVEYVYGKLKVTQSSDVNPPDDPDKKKEKEKKKKEKKTTPDRKRDDWGDRTNDNNDGGSVLGANRPKAEEPQVLGAQREEPGVLGARRGGTDDTTNTSRVFVLLIAAGAVATLLASDRKRKGNEEK